LTSLPKIVLISNGFQSDYEAGFANGLAANGLHPILISSDRTLVNRLLPDVTALNLRGSQEESRPTWQKMAQMLAYFIRLGLFLARHRPVTHLTGLFALSHIKGSYAETVWALECRVWKLLSQRLLLTVHNVVPHGRDTPAMRQRMRHIYKIPACLVVHTDQMSQRLIDEFGVAPERIVVMQHGIDHMAAESSEAIAATRAALGTQPDQKLVLCFGIVQRYKGVDLLIGAAQHFGDNIRVHIAGRCSDRSYQTELEKSLKLSRNSARLAWENEWLSEARADDLLAAADLLVLPYRQIDQSGVLFAAMRHGLPVVAFDVGSFRQYLNAEMGVVVEPGNTVALAEAIQQIDCSAVARAKVRAYAKQFLWRETVKPILAVYKDKPSC
jgi:glycosyltransferase involved in cell wall biosynthesis